MHAPESEYPHIEHQWTERSEIFETTKDLSYNTYYVCHFAPLTQRVRLKL